MKIAIWSGLGRIGPYVTGVGKHIVNVTRGLAVQDGYDVRLILPAGDRGAGADTRAGADAQVESPLAGIPGVVLPLKRRQLEALWQTIKAPKIDKWVRDTDWIYCPKETYVPVRNARYAVTVHDLYAHEDKLRGNDRRIDLWRRRNLLRRALDDATTVLAVSEFTKSRIVKLLGTDPKKIRVVGNGVENMFFQLPANLRSSCPPRDGQRYVLSVGGLTRKKGARGLLNLAEILAEQTPDIDLVVTGPVEKEFEEALRSARNIRHLGRGFPDAEMQTLVGHAVASVILSEYEGFGIPALEAMAAGVPVVAARRAALPEVVGNAGMLVDPADDRAASDAVLAIARGHCVRDDLIERGRRHARQFTWDACVARVAAAMEEFSGNRPSRGL